MKNVTVKQMLNDITDTFTGADGGISYLKLRILLEDLERRSTPENDHNSKNHTKAPRGFP